MPEAAELDLVELMSPGSHGRLVTLDGTLVERYAISYDRSLVVSYRGMQFPVNASLVSEAHLHSLKPGSVLRLSGVCEVRADEWRRPVGFSLLLPNEASIRLLKKPSWFTPGHTKAVFLGLLVVGLLTLAWVLTLRARVVKQTSEIETEFREKSNLMEMYERLFENAGDLVLRLHADGRVINMNRSAENTFERPRKSMRNVKLSRFLEEENAGEWDRALGQLAQVQEPISMELKVVPEKGPARDLEARIQLEEMDGVREVLCIARDVTERRLLESEVRQLQKMESIGQLAAGVAHDYNNLMTIVIGNADILADEFETQGRPDPVVSDIRDAAQRASNLTRQLLAFSRKQVMNKNVLAPAELLEDIGRMLKPLLGPQIDMKIQAGKRLPLIEVDRSMLEQVILNLAINARANRHSLQPDERSC